MGVDELGKHHDKGLDEDLVLGGGQAVGARPQDVVQNVAQLVAGTLNKIEAGGR